MLLCIRFSQRIEKFQTTPNSFLYMQLFGGGSYTLVRTRYHNKRSQTISTNKKQLIMKKVKICFRCNLQFSYRFRTKLDVLNEIDTMVHEVLIAEVSITTEQMECIHESEVSIDSFYSFIFSLTIS